MALLERWQCHRISLALVVCALLSCAVTAVAQDELSPSLSGSLGDSYSQSTSTSGFNGTFDPETSSLTNGDYHTDVSDPTHSQLLGSALTPANNPYASFSVDTAPQTGILTDAQSLVDAGGFYFGGRRARSFTAGAGAAPLTTTGAGQAASAGFGLGTMGAAFANGVSGRAAFSGQTASSPGTALSFSGEGIPVPITENGVGVRQTTASLYGVQPSTTFLATDPVLSGDESGYEADLEILGDVAPPLVQAGQFFSPSTPTLPARFQYDDGQTPLRTPPEISGLVIGTPPEYGPSPSGFPDSTKGLAGLLPEAANGVSIFAPPGGAEASPFAPVSEGTVYGLHLTLNPNLHAPPLSEPVGVFQILERRAREQRIIHGMSISQASTIYQDDLRKYQRSLGRQPRKSTLDVGTPAYPGAESFVTRRLP